MDFFPQKICIEIKYNIEIKISIYFDKAVIKCYHIISLQYMWEWQGNGLSNSISLVLLGRLLLWTFPQNIYKEINQNKEIKMSNYFDEAVIECYQYYQPTKHVKWQGNGLSNSISLMLLGRLLLLTFPQNINKEKNQNKEIKISIYFHEAVIKCYQYYQPTIHVRMTR